MPQFRDKGFAVYLRPEMKQAVIRFAGMHNLTGSAACRFLICEGIAKMKSEGLIE